MGKDYSSYLQQKLDKENFQKLASLENSCVIDFVGEYVELCDPESVFIRTDSAQDISYIREKCLTLGEEKSLKASGHSYHFDGVFDQARDKKQTKYLVSKDSKASSYLNSIDRDKGLEEIRGYLKGIMKGKEVFVSFFCLGPLDSDFSILAVQITDSAYVSHSEDILFRPGYEQIKKTKDNIFFRFIHSAGRLENGVSIDTDKRRIYIDLDENLVYSTNTQYAGNTVGLKKLSLRLAIQRASAEGWLAEHMFLMGVHDKGKKEYFCGAYPSMCGKTSTAVLQGESIVGDDITYLRVRDGKAYAANVERGIFGIIKDVNLKDDSVLCKSLEKPGEIIFSNILIDNNDNPFWIGKSEDIPEQGVNFAGEWHRGKNDAEGRQIPPSHKNARYTIRLSSLENVDQELENPQGVLVKGLIYGGRDSDTSVPVEQALSWQQGIITKAASLESETTAATLGQEGVRVFNPMANMDFLSIPLSTYIKMNLEFGKKMSNPPLVFSANYFLKGKDGEFLNAIGDKRVWLKWMRLKVDSKVKALVTPTGLMPKYEDLKTLFQDVLGKEYAEEEYKEQFTLRIPENLAKIERILEIYKKQEDIPDYLFEELENQKSRLKDCQGKFGDYVNPINFSCKD